MTATADQLEARLEEARQSDRRRRAKASAAPLEFFSIAQAAELFGVCEQTIRNWIESRELKAVKLGGTVRIPRRSIEALAQ